MVDHLTLFSNPAHSAESIFKALFHIIRMHRIELTGMGIVGRRFINMNLLHIINTIVLTLAMNSSWEKIYQDYLEGRVFSALNEYLLSDFRSFVETSTFSTKKALEIGCGEGKYLRYLNELGFEVSAIDYSPTAVSIAQKGLNGKPHVVVADMYDYDIPKNEFDLIYSIAAIHHGKKEEVDNLIKRILSAVKKNGKVFITLPTYPEDGLLASLYRTSENIMNGNIFHIFSKSKIFRTLREHMVRKAWEDGKEWKYIGNGVVVPISGAEEGVIHSFYTRKEVKSIFSGCQSHSIEKKGNTWIIKITM